jgi:hypothetical protein
MEYKVVEASNASRLEERVTAHIKQGWRLVPGGFTAVVYGSSIWYCRELQRGSDVVATS